MSRYQIKCQFRSMCNPQMVWVCKKSYVSFQSLNYQWLGARPTPLPFLGCWSATTLEM